MPPIATPAPVPTPSADPRIDAAMWLPKTAMVAVAMSGGVDSSAVAGLLVEAGYRVFGLTARLYDVPTTERRPGSCCAPDDARDARNVAHHLGIRHYVLDERAAFQAEVVQPFIDGWQNAETPNPCVRCNRSLKFDKLLRAARGLGADVLATGHYARLELDADGQPALRRARDPAKDQAYFLYPLVPATVNGLRFPLGDLTKPEVRAHAERLGLPTAQKRESMDVCFIGGAKPQDWLAGRMAAQPGAVTDGQGRKVGEHPGLHAVTIGQRHGLRLANHSPTAEPLYVIDKRADGTVVAGPRQALRAGTVQLVDCTWVGGVAPQPGAQVGLQVRHRSSPAQATILATAGPATVTVQLQQEVFAAARGQAGVLFVGDRVLGGGTIGQVWAHCAAEVPAHG